MELIRAGVSSVLCTVVDFMNHINPVGVHRKISFHAPTATQIRN